MAARFLASAFAGGPALLIILSIIVRRLSKFDPGKEPIQAIGKIVTYAMFANVFFLLFEVFTAFTAGSPGIDTPSNTSLSALKAMGSSFP